MKTYLFYFFVFTVLLCACRQKRGRLQENRLEKQFEKYIARKEFVKRIEIDSPNVSEKDTFSYFIGYDSLQRIVNKANSNFYEYDTLGRITKQYKCVLSRDPTCSKPYIFFYEYWDGKLLRIKILNNFANDTVPYVRETFIYDDKNRLVEHTKFPTDTLTYSYDGNDTSKRSEHRIYWISNADNKWVKVSRTTTFQYDSLGRRISLTWSDPDNGMSWKNDFFYDDYNRLIMKKDTSLGNFTKVPNSCCILYLTSYKYDRFGRLIQEDHSTGSYDNPKPQFQRSINFQY